MTICLVIPAYNEELIIQDTIFEILQMLEKTGLKQHTKLIIANNGSTDLTKEKVDAVSDPILQQIWVNAPGKGEAIKRGFLSCEAEVYVFMDADLATDLSAFPVLMQEMRNGTDIVIGSRTHKESIVKRQHLRHLYSKQYSRFIRHYFHVPISDFPCGFKAFSKKVIQDVMPEVENMQWFFDPELLIRAHKKGYVIREIPILWKEEGINEKRKSKLHVLPAAFACLKEMQRLKSRLS